MIGVGYPHRPREHNVQEDCGLAKDQRNFCRPTPVPCHAIPFLTCRRAPTAGSEDERKAEGDDRGDVAEIDDELADDENVAERLDSINDLLTLLGR